MRDCGLFSGYAKAAIFPAFLRAPIRARCLIPHPFSLRPQSVLVVLRPFLFNGTAFWLMALAVVALLFWALSAEWSPRPAIAISLLKVTFGGTARRRLARRGARFYRRFIVWVSSGWRAFLFVYLAAAVLLAVQHILTAKDSAAMAKWLWDQPPAHLPLVALHWFLRSGAGPWLQAFALAALLCLLPAAFRARRRIVIAAFVNATGDSTRAAAADGLGRRLMAELSEIREIYQDVSDDPSDLSVDPKFDLGLAVAAASAFSDLTASFKGQQVEVWGFKIPLDWAVTTLSALVRGPQIKGSLQNTADGLMFEASLTGGGYDLAWRVTAVDIQPTADDAANPQAANAEIMVRQLAYRIFANLAQDQVGTASWRAVQQYTQALQAFRRTKRDTANRDRQMQQAQQGFFQAYRFDNHFVRSRYNLGVILYSQYQYEAAYEVFKKVINESANSQPADPSPSDTKARRRFLSRLHYAAAKAAQGITDIKPPEGLDDVQRDREKQSYAKFQDRMDYHVKNAIQLNPRDARAWNLQGVILFKTDPGGAETRKCARTAVALSWSALCAAELSGKLRGTAAALAALHLANLSKALANQPASTKIMHLAIDLSPSNASNWRDLGGFYLRQGKTAKALCAFEMANRIEEKPINWLWIACTRRLLSMDESKRDNIPPMQSFAYAWKCTIEDGTDALFVQNEFKGFWQEWDGSVANRKTKLDLDGWKEEAGERASLIAAINADWKRLCVNPPAGGNPPSADEIADSVDKWEKRLAQLDEKQEWHKAQIHILLCGLHDQARDNLGTTNLETAIGLLALNHRAEITAGSLRSVLAQRALAGLSAEEGSLASPSRLDGVLKMMIAALKQNPNAVSERSLLAQVYLAMGRTEMAAEQLQNAISLDPNNDQVREVGLGISLKKFPALREPKTRQSALERMVLDSCNEAADAENDVWKIDRSKVGRTRYLLGLFSLELLDFDAMRSSFETAVACRYKPLECLTNLCETHFRCCDPDEGERNYKRLLAFLNDLFPLYGKGDFRLLECSDSLKGTFQEQKPPAFWLAWAAIFTATAMAEQGRTCTAAKARSQTARLWTRQLDLKFKNAQNTDKSITEDDLSDLHAGISFCLGAIFRSGAHQALNTAANRVWFLRQAIRRFNRALELTTGTNGPLRPDALYRKAGACAELAAADPANAQQARTLAAEAVTLAQIADLRGEYKSRIEQFIQELGSAADSGSLPKTTFLPKDQQAPVQQAPVASTQPAPPA
jgi:tetratricopeptide (TPR) repeat protein